MAEARQRDQWSRTSVLLTLLANAHRDPKKSRPFKPADFDPFARGATPINDKDALKALFMRQKETKSGENAPQSRREHRD